MLDIFRVALLLIAILDPFMATPAFLAMTKKIRDKEKMKLLAYGVLTAGLIMAVFLFIGMPILSFFQITLPAFKVAGGIVLFIVGLQLVLGYEIVKKEKAKENIGIALLLGTPLLAGPAAITTIILVSQEYGYVDSSIGLVLALVISFVIMLLGTKIVGAIGKKGVEIISRIMGLLLAAFAIEFIRAGIVAMLI